MCACVGTHRLRGHIQVCKGLFKEQGRPSFLVAVKSLHIAVSGNREDLLREAAMMAQVRPDGR